MLGRVLRWLDRCIHRLMCTPVDKWTKLVLPSRHHNGIVPRRRGFNVVAAHRRDGRRRSWADLPALHSLSPCAPRRVRLNGDARLGAAQRLRDGRRDVRFVRCPRTSNSSPTGTRRRLIGLLTVTLALLSDFVAQRVLIGLDAPASIVSRVSRSECGHRSLKLR